MFDVLDTFFYWPVIFLQYRVYPRNNYKINDFDLFS